MGSLPRGKRLAPGYYEYVDKPSGVAWRVSYNDELRPPEWQASIDNGESDGAYPTRRECVESIVGWIDEIYDIYDGLTYDEVYEIRFGTWSDDFKRHIGKSILAWMNENEIDVFDRKEFGA